MCARGIMGALLYVYAELGCVASPQIKVDMSILGIKIDSGDRREDMNTSGFRLFGSCTLLIPLPVESCRKEHCSSSAVALTPNGRPAEPPMTGL